MRIWSVATALMVVMGCGEDARVGTDMGMPGPDLGPPDVGPPDEGMPDEGLADAGMPDADMGSDDLGDPDLGEDAGADADMGGMDPCALASVATLGTPQLGPDEGTNIVPLCPYDRGQEMADVRAFFGPQVPGEGVTAGGRVFGFVSAAFPRDVVGDHCFPFAEFAASRAEPMGPPAFELRVNGSPNRPTTGPSTSTWLFDNLRTSVVAIAGATPMRSLRANPPPPLAPSFAPEDVPGSLGSLSWTPGRDRDSSIRVVVSQDGGTSPYACHLRDDGFAQLPLPTGGAASGSWSLLVEARRIYTFSAGTERIEVLEQDYQTPVEVPFSIR